LQDKKPYWLGRALVNTYTRILKNNNSLLQGDISKGAGVGVGHGFSFSCVSKKRGKQRLEGKA
jgi:hypothetical protein